jgi:hypothetical protein
LVSTLEVILCALAAVAYWTLPGFAIARRIAPSALAGPIAPALGFAAHSAGTLPIFFLVGFSTSTIGAVAALTVLASIAALSAKPSSEGDGGIRIPILAVAVAALLAVAPALAILPKSAPDGVILAGPIFDHAKVAIIDAMVRLGLPPQNPFFSEPSRLAYYYLWHFGAAELALPLRATGWEADVAMTWFAAFASLMLMMGLAAWFGARTSAAFFVLPLCLAASLRPCLIWVFGPELYNYILPPTGFAGWLFQASWVPQHLTSASCVVLAVFLINQLASRPSALLVATLALVVAAGFESSTWIGGVTFAAAAPIIGAIPLIGGRPRLPFLLGSVTAAALALALVFPLAHDQYVATAMRGGGPTLALEPIGVFEDFISEDFSAIIDLPGYWLVLLAIEFPAIYLTGTVVLVQLARSRSLDPTKTRVAQAFAALVAVSLTVAWLIASTIGENDDLGWRAILPGVLGMTIFSAVGLSRWLAVRARFAAAAGIAAVLLGLPDGARLICQFAAGAPEPSRAVFAASPAMWEEVRRHSAPDDRIANNPLFLHDMTNWPVNISWALLANRRSCYAGKDLALAFASLSDEQREAIDAQFVRVFAGDGSPNDVRELATRYNCHLVVLTAQDGAWTRDPFTKSPCFRLVEANAERWKIYVAAKCPSSSTEAK